MATAVEVRNRISSVQDTRKITNAMYMIASKKVRKAKADLDRTRPYFEILKTEIKRVFRTDQDVQSEYFYPPRSEPDLKGPRGFLVITADKGLAGAYNLNVLKVAQTIMEEDGWSSQDKLFVVGAYGRQYFQARGVAIEQSFLYTAQNPTMDRAREIADIVLEYYKRRELVKFYVIYTDFANVVEEEVIRTRLLPFHRADFESPTVEREIKHPFEFRPSLSRVLEQIVPSYVAGFIYSALIDSFCSEQNARMTAMDAATQNADELLEELQMDYHHLRQNAITQEITEIASGARAAKKKSGRAGRLQK